MRRRQPAQTAVLAAVAMTCLIGALSMVIDAGVYFVIQRELQNAADAAALAAVWYGPACFETLPGWQTAGCQNHASLTPVPECQTAEHGPSPGNDDPAPCTAAVQMTQANWGVALSLCSGPSTGSTVPIVIDTHPGIPPAGAENVPNVTPYVVTLSCDAPHWFAHILPGVGLSMQIGASSSAALGWLGPSGQLQGGNTPPNPPQPLVARLLNAQ